MLLTAASAPSHADWADATDVLMVKPAPILFAVQPQNPPAFAWARYPAASLVPSYMLEIQQDGKVLGTYTATRNFFLPTKAMAPGRYTWRVRPSTRADWSTPRGFTIDATSLTFEVPDSSVIKANVMAHGRPRQLPKNFQPYSAWSAQKRKDLGPALTALSTEIKGGMVTVPSISDALWPMNVALSAADASRRFTDVANKTSASLRQFEASSFLFRLTGDNSYLAEAIKRGDQLSALDPNGASSYANQDQASRNIAMALLKACDYLWSDLDAPRRTRWLAMVNTRVGVIYSDLSAEGGRMDQYPFDSHGADAYGYLALFAALGIGDLPAAQQWFDFAVRPYINSIFIWSGPEGGHASGTPYGTYSAAYFLQLWGPLKEVTGVNLYDKPWSLGFARMLMHFLPPGAPGFVFGDAHETPLDKPLLKAFSARFRTPEAAWYSRNIIGDEDPLNLLLAEYPLPATTVAAPKPPPDAGLYPSTGVVAMHSSMADRGRSSVYFKSSPYGSYNHSHGDQNSIVIDSGGYRLLTEAGYQDYYYSPLVMSWYRQTKAHNAVTFDGGVGQLIVGQDNIIRNGKITAFSTTPALDFTEGDASAAYGPVLKSAIRRVWYVRGSNTVLVQDVLTAPAPHVYEWNMHAIAPIVGNGANKARIVNNTSSLCITSLSGDDTFKKVAGPSRPGVTEDHAAFIKTAATPKAEFLVVLDIGCKGIAAKLSDSRLGRQVQVGGQNINLP